MLPIALLSVTLLKEKNNLTCQTNSEISSNKHRKIDTKMVLLILIDVIIYL